MTTSENHFAPIGLFIYKRPEHTRRTIRSLQSCDGFDESPLVVFADGPESEAEISAVRATRAAARELLGDRAVFVEREQNRGLQESIINGVTELCDRFGEAVIVEEDLILHRRFLHFLNEGLRHYRDEPRVMSIAGHQFGSPQVRDPRAAVLVPSLVDSQGWATWKRAWDLFDPAPTGWQDLLADEDVATRFDLGGRRPFVDTLRRQARQQPRIDWDMCWYHTLFVHDGLVLYPPRTLVLNGDFNLSGTHEHFARRQPELIDDGDWRYVMPSEVAPSPDAEAIFDARVLGAKRGLWLTAKAYLARLRSAR